MGAQTTEWDCSTTSGTFTLSTDCVVSSEIVVTGSLDVTVLNISGIPDAQGILPKIIGGGSNRLFKVENGGHLTVWSLNLTRGNVGTNNNNATNSSDVGGALYVNNGSLTLFSSVVHGNRARTGGGHSSGSEQRS